LARVFAVRPITARMQNISLALIGKSGLLLSTQGKNRETMIRSKLHKTSGRTLPRGKRYLSELLFALGVTISLILPNILFAAVSGSFSLVFILFFISSSLGVMLGFAFYVPRVRLFQQRETVRLLKTQHKEFFRQIRSNVAHLLEKGGPDERLLPGRS
jgi:hypothetical protein